MSILDGTIWVGLKLLCSKLEIWFGTIKPSFISEGREDKKTKSPKTPA